MNRYEIMIKELEEYEVIDLIKVLIDLALTTGELEHQLEVYNFIDEYCIKKVYKED